MIDENLIKELAKKYDLFLKHEYKKPGVNSYTLSLDGKDICYYSTFRAGWVQACTQVYVNWFITEKPKVGFGDKFNAK